MRYVRAEEVLPPDLLAKVRQHHTGLIYVSADRGFYERRARQVLLLHAEGLPTREIAERVHLTRRRVQQILQHRRNANDNRSVPLDGRSTALRGGGGPSTR